MVKSMLVLADTIAGDREKLRKLKEEERILRAKLEAEKAELAEMMTEEEVNNFRRGDRQFILTRNLHAGVRGGRQDDFFEWLRKNDLGDLIRETVHVKTLESWVKSYRDEETSELDLPDELRDLLNIFEKPDISVRKA